MSTAEERADILMQAAKEVCVELGTDLGCEVEYFV
jgi:hypothetical protein